jgi:RNA polymerase sigma-70 factor, ECF subfamily
VYRDSIVSIYRLMYSKVGNQSDAEDLSSQVFLGALPHLRSGVTGGEVHRYLLATAGTVLADHWRHHLGAALSSLDEEVGVADRWDRDGGEARASERVGRVRRVLGGLPANHRTILELRFLAGCLLREAAARMGISMSNAKVVRYRALRRAAELEPEVTL